MEINSLPEKNNNLLLTSLEFKIKSPLNEEKEEESNKISQLALSFPKIRYKTFNKNKNFKTIPLRNSKKEELFIKNMKTFIAPISKTILEKKELNKIKNNLILKRFKELHNYKLKINPKNYYHNYGLNDFILITNKNKNKSRNNDDYKYNNISSYNNIIKTEEEKYDKKTKIIKSVKKEKEMLLTNVPYRLKNANSNKGIMKFDKNDTLFGKNSIWRGKNINEMIHNSINFDFFQIFLKNSKSMGKIKFFK